MTKSKKEIRATKLFEFKKSVSPDPLALPDKGDTDGCCIDCVVGCVDPFILSYIYYNIRKTYRKPFIR